jgi:hypothetical protein
MKTNNIVLCLLLGSAWLLQSCSIATTVHFNKDFSGTYTMALDMSDMISMAGAFDTTGAVDQDQMIQQLRDSIGMLHLEDAFQSVSGVSDANVEVSDEGEIILGFAFDNIESLNAGCLALTEAMAEIPSDSEMPTGDLLGAQMFEQQGKTISYTMSSESGLGEGLMSGDESEMDMISSMMDYTIDLSFDRKVHSVDVEGLTIVEKGKNIVKTRVDFAQFLKEGKYSVKVKTK